MNQQQQQQQPSRKQHRQRQRKKTEAPPQPLALDDPRLVVQAAATLLSPCGKSTVVESPPQRQMPPPAMPHHSMTISAVANPNGGPLFPSFHMYEARLASFDLWPKAMRQHPQAMARAGFVYNGYGDCVTCYFCGGKLGDWWEHNDPWLCHIRFFPRCGFVQRHLSSARIATAVPPAEKQRSSSSSVTVEAKVCTCGSNEPAEVRIECEHSLACLSCAVSHAACPRAVDF